MNPRRAILILGLLVAAGLTTGCEKPLLSDTEERSPFDRYDAVRNQYSEQRQMNEFGRMRPDLRGRLLPKD